MIAAVLDTKASDPHYTYCGYNGHRVDECFQLHGYPPYWTGPKGKRSTSAHATFANQEASSLNCNEQPKFSFTPKEFQKLMTLPNSTPSDPPTQNNTRSAVIFASTSYISNNVSYFAHCASNSFKQNSWILDMDATDHMICSPLFYHTAPQSINAFIHLPNGVKVPASPIGTVCLSNSILLHDVL